jgi:hypothetical protein
MDAVPNAAEVTSKGEPLGDVLARECPAYATGTLVLKDEGGHVVGYGRVKRTGEFAVEVTVSSSPAGVAFLRPPPRPEGA